MRQSTNRRSLAEPQVWFRIVHVAVDGHHRALGDAIREQTVEIALGPKGAFKNGNVGAVTRNVAANRVVELLRKALEWQALLESGEVRNQTEIARREGVTRARVTQVIGMLRLAPEIQQQVLSMRKVAKWPVVTERALRPIVRIREEREQMRLFAELCRTSPHQPGAQATRSS